MPREYMYSSKDSPLQLFVFFLVGQFLALFVEMVSHVDIYFVFFSLLTDTSS